MEQYSCAYCGYFLKSTDNKCPKCGSDERNILINLLERAEIREYLSLSIINYHKIWTYIPKAIQFNIRNLSGDPKEVPIPGLCLDIIGSTASLVEGIITDHIVQELETFSSDPVKKERNRLWLGIMHKKGWDKKKKIIKELGWEIEDLENYELVEMLFSLRNNIAHGKTYNLIDSRKFTGKAFTRIQPVSIENENYLKVYHFLMNRGIVHDINQHPILSIELFLTPAVAEYFYEGTKTFLHAFFKHIKLSSKLNMYPEFVNSL